MTEPWRSKSMPQSPEDEEYEDAWEQAKKDGFIDYMKENLGHLAESTMVLSIHPKEDIDVKFACEIGYSVLLGKPIVLAIAKGTEISDKMKLIADHIVEMDWDTPEGRDRGAEEIGRIAGQMHRDGLI